jgi:DNA processing protein
MSNMLHETSEAPPLGLRSTDSQQERIYYCAWASIRGIGPKLLLKIGNHFGSFFVAWNAQTDSQPNWQQFLERTKDIRQKISPKQIYESLSLTNPSFLTLPEASYPSALRQSYPEPLLYFRGNQELLQATHQVAIVGSRQFDQYASRALRRIIAELAGQPIIIVSGLAFGIDALAHQLALDYQLPTIAVLGSSVHEREIYPRSNWRLAESIIQHNGLLVSPFRYGTAIRNQNFPQRNSTIAGLSTMTVVVSAARRSGALITAQLAMDAGREVMTMPGNIDQPLSAGTNWLAQQGAQIITSGQDITDALHLQTATQTNNNYITDDPLMQEILQKIQTSAMRLEDLSDQLTNYDQTMITIAISKLELRGWIERRVGNYIQLR